MANIPYKRDYDVFVVRPLDTFNQNPLDFTNDGSVSTFKVYDEAKDSILTGDASSTTLNVASAGLYQIGDEAEVELDDLTMFEAGAITAVDTTNNTITVTNSVTSSTDRKVRVRLGSEINMVEYGVAAIGSNGYGFKGVMPWNHPGLNIGMDIDIEIKFIGAPPNGLVGYSHICGTIVDNC